jgi:primosomal protein N' (replication factor Y)
MPPDTLRAGLIVEVPFGTRTLIGLTTAPARRWRTGDPQPDRLRPISGLVTAPFADQPLWDTLTWAARWTMQPLPRVLESALSLRDLAVARPPQGEAWRRVLVDAEEEFVLIPVPEAPPPPRAPAAEAWQRALAAGQIAADMLDDLYRDPQAVLRRWLAEGRIRRIAQRPPVSTRTAETVTLTPEQAEANAALASLQSEAVHRIVLLEGITGSGKTEVYAEAARRTLAAGRQVLVLVPEISLAGPTAARLSSRLGVPVWTWHSALAGGLRAKARAAALSGRPGILVGPRSAALAPLSALGLVVVDEEHDPAYAAQEGVGLHARDVAVFRSKAAGVPVILASATPAMETATAARDGRIMWLRLRQRPGGAVLPRVQLVDVDQRDERGPFPWLSRSLERAIDDTLAAGRQVVLFRNRRGFHPVVQCRACRETLRCPTCSADLTLHARPRELRCHLCGVRTDWTERCTMCGEEGRLRPLGTGTQRVEEDLRGRWPTARIDRLDRDVLTSQGRIDGVLARLQQGETDILVGTQLVTKGLDVAGITLVGVIQIDGALHIPDFRASERVFQQLCQVSGRAGRGNDPGTVIIQTAQPGHPVLKLALAQDVDGFFDHEIKARTRSGLPPRSRLVRLVWAGPNESELLDDIAASLAAAASVGPARVWGPAPCPIERIRGIWRQHVFGLDDDLRRLRRWALDVAAAADGDVRIEVEPQVIS